MQTPIFYSLSGKVRVSAFLLSEPPLYVAEVASAPDAWSIILDADFEVAPQYAATLGTATRDLNKAIDSALACDPYCDAKDPDDDFDPDDANRRLSEAYHERMGDNPADDDPNDFWCRCGHPETGEIIPRGHSVDVFCRTCGGCLQVG